MLQERKGAGGGGWVVEDMGEGGEEVGAKADFS